MYSASPEVTADVSCLLVVNTQLPGSGKSSHVRRYGAALLPYSMGVVAGFGPTLGTDQLVIVAESDKGQCKDRVLSRDYAILSMARRISTRGGPPENPGTRGQG